MNAYAIDVSLARTLESPRVGASPRAASLATSPLSVLSCIPHAPDRGHEGSEQHRPAPSRPRGAHHPSVAAKRLSRRRLVNIDATADPWSTCDAPRRATSRASTSAFAQFDARERPRYQRVT